MRNLFCGLRIFLCKVRNSTCEKLTNACGNHIKTCIHRKRVADSRNPFLLLQKPSNSLLTIFCHTGFGVYFGALFDSRGEI